MNHHADSDRQSLAAGLHATVRTHRDIGEIDTVKAGRPGDVVRTKDRLISTKPLIQKHVADKSNRSQPGLPRGGDDWISPF